MACIPDCRSRTFFAVFRWTDTKSRKTSNFLRFLNFQLSMSQTSASPSAPAPTVTPAINFATEWLDEHGNVCLKAVDYASQCPKGHALVAFADGGGDASAQRVMCRVCHVITEREHTSQWRACSVTGCCSGYAVCQRCASALQEPPAAAAGGGDFPLLVCAADHVCESCGWLS
jgi:hypothetical protein